MEDDVSRLYAANIRISSDAYDYLLRHDISRTALRLLLLSESPILTMDDVRSATAESSKIPMPIPTRGPEAQKDETPVTSSPANPSPSHAHHPSASDALAAPAHQPSVLHSPPAPAQSSAPPASRPTSRIIESGPMKDDMLTRPTMPSPSSFSGNAIRYSMAPPPAIVKKTVSSPNSPPWASAPAAHPRPASEIMTDVPATEITGPSAPSSTAPPQVPIPVEVIRPSSFKPIAKEYSPRIVIHEHRDVSGQSRCIGSVEDFVAYFRDRFERESQILRTRPSNLALVRTDQLSAHQNEDVRIIAMIAEKRITAKGNLFLEIEDEQGQVRALVGPREKCFDSAKTVLKDDVVALDGRMGPNFFMLKAITWPDLPVIRTQPQVSEDIAIAYLSDTHVGSRYFMEKSFKKFIRWLWGQEGREELAGKVKYLIVAGDLVDGIGVYPAQEKELTIKDIYEQYAAFDSLIESLPDHIEVIVSPGNHDAVRRGEPQPLIPMDLLKTDVKKIGSPSSLTIEGLKHLVYHGTSIDSMIANVSGLSYAKPEGPMLEMLKRRHLSPIYGENLIVPELRDYMVISEEPDVMHMGHIHKNASMKYRGTLMINSGTFQERTDFQVKMGHIPTPGIVPILELKSQQLSHLKFTDDLI